MSLASRIALGNTGESCSPAVIFLTESGKKHIDDSKRRHDKVIKKRPRRPKMKKLNHSGGKNVIPNIDRPSIQTASVTENNPDLGNDGWVRLLYSL